MNQLRKCLDKRFAVLVLGLFGFAIVSSIGCEKMRAEREKKMGFPSAHYSTMSFYETVGQAGFSKLKTSRYRGLAEIYIEFPDGSRHFLPEINEEVVAKNLEKLELINQDNRKTEYGDGASHIIFLNGELQRLKLEAGLATWKIAAKEEGPYFALPISKTDLVEQFGEPDSWDVYVPPRVP